MLSFQPPVSWAANLLSYFQARSCQLIPILSTEQWGKDFPYAVRGGSVEETIAIGRVVRLLLAEESILERDVAGSCHRVLLLFTSGYIMKSYLLRRFTPASSSIGPDGWYRNLRHLAIVMR